MPSGTTDSSHEDSLAGAKLTSIPLSLEFIDTQLARLEKTVVTLSARLCSILRTPTEAQVCVNEPPTIERCDLATELKVIHSRLIAIGHRFDEIINRIEL